MDPIEKGETDAVQIKQELGSDFAKEMGVSNDTYPNPSDTVLSRSDCEKLAASRQHRAPITKRPTEYRFFGNHRSCSLCTP